MSEDTSAIPDVANASVDPSIRDAGRRRQTFALVSIFGGFLLTVLTIARIGDIHTVSIGILYPLGYALLAVGLAGGARHFQRYYGNSGTRLAWVLALSLACYAGSILVVVASQRFGGLPTGSVTGLVSLSFFAARLLAMLYGVVLWTRTPVSKVTAGLFVLALPSLLVVAPFGFLGATVFAAQASLYVASMGFGCSLLRTGSGLPSNGP